MTPRKHPRALAATLTTAAAALLAPAAAMAAAPPDRTCANEFLLGGQYNNVLVAPGTWCLIGNATIEGDLHADHATSIGIFFTTTIKGDVTITSTTANPDATGETFGGSADAICTSTIRGDLTITNSSPDAPWNIGSTNYPPFVNFSNCLGANTIGGDVRFRGNASKLNAIGGNNIGGDLVCGRNRGFAKGVVEPDVPNDVHGTRHGDCGSGDQSPTTPPAPTRCRSHRRFVLRLSRRLVTARVVVHSAPRYRRARVLRGRRLRAVIDLRGLPEQRVVVVVRGRTRSGRVRRFVRTYRTCGPRG